MAHTKKEDGPLGIVGIGASAGGLEALEQFFDGMSVDSGLAFVVIQHLLPGVESRMVELLACHTRMPVGPIRDKGRLGQNRVYLIPPGCRATIENGRFRLGANAAGAPVQTLIDQFLGSLAAEAGARGIGVILSGTGGDGSLGIRAIHEAGGLVVAQLPGSARYDGMPKSAIETGICDLILPPAQIPDRLLNHLENRPLTRSAGVGGATHGGRAERESGSPPAHLAAIERQVLHDYDALLERHIPVGVLIDGDCRILHYFGAVTPYLKTPKGRVEINRFSLRDDNLQVAFSASLQRAVTTGLRTVTRGIRMREGDRDSLTDLTVDPIPDPDTGTVHFHVHFGRPRPAKRLPAAGTAVGRFAAASYSRQLIGDLEAQLKASGEELETLRRQLLACGEEQQAVVEEYQTTNEELRSANDELHGANEALNSVNAQLERKNLEFRRLSSEHDNMLTSIDSGMVFLDRELRIRRFNPAIASFFTLRPEDIGRPLSDIAFHLADRAQMQVDILRVLASAGSLSREVEAPDGEWLLVRIMPFKGEAEQVDGVVISFTDISPTKKAEQTVQVLNQRLKRANDKLLKVNEGLELRVRERTRELEKIRIELEAQNAELQASHRELELQTAQRTRTVEELRKKERLLIQQSRLAAMGEMLANIAHQWRQPMNILGLKIQEIGLSYEMGGFSKELLDTNIDKALEILFHLSRTIDDFRDFSAPDKEKCLFRLESLVGKTVSLLKENFRELGIEIEVDITGEPQVNGFPNEYRQALLNILMNAKDALSERKIRSALIAVNAWSTDGRAVLTVTDNAGGIDGEIMEKIFDPYFTTKELGKGTGIGLFMSKTIVEKNMGGRLTVRNVDNGVEFKIEV